jgi:hypothetical protein
MSFGEWAFGELTLYIPYESTEQKRINTTEIKELDLLCHSIIKKL